MSAEDEAKEFKENKAETPKRARANAAQLPVIVKSVPTLSPSPTLTNSVTMALHRIPRPPNAFMIFANENRKLLAEKHRRESNKEISIRLGKMWRALADDVKGKYHAQAKLTDLEHKKKYPDYVYNPRDARLRKEARRQRQIAGQNLARAMSHHLMVKQAKSSLIQLNSQRLGMQVAQPMAVPCMSSPSNLQSQASTMRREQEMLRGLTFDGGMEKRPMGYFVTPSGQTCALQGYPTLLNPRSLPMHLLANSMASATMTNSAGVLSNQAFSRAPDLVTSTASYIQSMANNYASQEEQQHQQNIQEAITRAEVANSNFALQTSLAQMQSPQPMLPETVQKNALLTLATEAVSQLSVGQPEMKDETETEINHSPPVVVENIVQLPEGEPATATCVLEQIASEMEREKELAQEESDKKDDQPMMVEEEKNITEPAPEEEMKDKISAAESGVKFETQKTDGIYQRFEDAFNQKAPIMTTWVSKPESPSLRMGRHLPLYLVHPSNPTLLAVRPSASGCMPYQVGPAPSSASQVMAGNPGGVVPWGGGPFFYMPMADMQPVAHMPPYAYDANGLPYAYDTNLLPTTAMSFEPCFTKGKKMAFPRESRPVLVKSSDAYAKMNPAVAAATTVTGSSPEGNSSRSENGSRVFGQILSSTMQLLNEENGGGDAKPLTPTCHINYEVVEKEASPDRKLSELGPVQPNTQYTIYY